MYPDVSFNETLLVEVQSSLYPINSTGLLHIVTSTSIESFPDISIY